MVCHADDPFVGIKTAELAAKIKFYDLRPQIPEDTPDILRTVMTACWQLEPALRPNGGRDLPNGA